MPHTVVPAIILGTFFVGAVLFIGYYNPNKDDVRNGASEIGAFRSVLRTSIRRGGDAVTGWRIALSRTARLQWARVTLNPFQLNAAELDGLDRLNGSRLHKVAQSEITQLIAALSATQADLDNPGRDRALACYDAAALLAAERNDRLDLLGAVVLAREGQTALADRDPLPLPVCQVHPLHGPAVRRPPPRRRPPPGKPHTVCAGCERCSMQERHKRALRVAGVPYYRTSGFWSTVGFGALDPELPARVLEYMHVG